MGRRKVKPRAKPKRKERLPTNFQCLICHNLTSVKADLSHAAGVGSLECTNCQLVQYHCKIKPLDGPIDVYTAYCDEYETLVAINNNAPFEEDGSPSGGDFNLFRSGDPNSTKSQKTKLPLTEIKKQENNEIDEIKDDEDSSSDFLETELQRIEKEKSEVNTDSKKEEF